MAFVVDEIEVVDVEGTVVDVDGEIVLLMVVVAGIVTCEVVDEGTKIGTVDVMCAVDNVEPVVVDTVNVVDGIVVEAVAVSTRIDVVVEKMSVADDNLVSVVVED